MYSVETSVVINVLSCTELQMYMVRLNVSVSNTFRFHLVRDSTAFYDISLCFILDAWWWRHQMETSSALLALCAGTSPVTGEFPSQRPVARSFDVFFDLRRNKLFSKQSWRWWFETPSRSLWRQRHGNLPGDFLYSVFKVELLFVIKQWLVLCNGSCWI